MVGCMLCYSLYITAQFYPRFETLLPAATILGFAAAPLWISKCAYLTKVSHTPSPKSTPLQESAFSPLLYY